ncbi:SRPBCC domain-containing protein [Conexibacter sp. DBS9H8]|uniref:SRPBCC family protein n=1 Tax=Conexibacter sp. DBS9H8 TaxID=2937801 RepID=UPI00200D7782|nr:SRPBCC domain-containing protein [Conexibacter sp. DBS9H8]
MATIVRSGLVAAPPEAVWELIADARSLPRWWPQVSRVEGVLPTGFTQVLVSPRGRPVRLDLFYTTVEEPVRLGWALDISGGQFDRFMAEWHTDFELEPASGGTRVQISERQSFRGSYKTGTLLQRRASGKRLDAALAGLIAVF